MSVASTANSPALEAELLDLARRAARAGGAELMDRWQGPLQVRNKTTDTDPVSDADYASQAAILELIGRERPADTVLAEEDGETAAPPTGDVVRWVIDPLDGTVNYLYGLPQFVVSVAVQDATGELAGVVYDPVRDETYLATRSGPALRYPAGAVEPHELSASTCDRLSQALVATGFAYDARVRELQGRILANLVGRVRDVRRAGAAALDLALAGAGHLDAYYERGVQLWDIAAGRLICERAGLTVLELPETDELPFGVLVAPRALAHELFELVASIH